MSEHSSGTFQERLWPSIGFFLATLLVIPAFTVLFMPYSLTAGIIAGVVVYAVVALVFILGSKKVEVADGKLRAGRAEIDVEYLGEVEVLDDQELRIAIGRRLDARAYLSISGWVKRGVKIMLKDPNDPTPYWVVSSRKPTLLAQAISESQQR